MPTPLASQQPPTSVPSSPRGILGYARFLLLGVYFGFVLIKAQAVSWVKMQEMFRFESFYYFGMFATALATAWIGVWLIKRFQIRSISGETIRMVTRPFERANIYGGLIFGLGWGMAGICPGPIYASIGAGISVMILTLASAVLGTYVYGVLKPRLPH